MVTGELRSPRSMFCTCEQQKRHYRQKKHGRHEKLMSTRSTKYGVGNVDSYGSGTVLGAPPQVQAFQSRRVHQHQ
jgi:hypothetical protein